jgi:hypothetical protein
VLYLSKVYLVVRFHLLAQPLINEESRIQILEIFYQLPADS